MIVATLAVFLVVRRSSIASRLDDLSVITNQTAEQIDGYIRVMDNLALQVFADPGVRELLDAANQSTDPRNFFTYQRDAAREMESRLLTISGPLVTALRLAVFSRNGDSMDFGLFTMADTLVSANLESAPWVPTVYERSGGKVVVPPHFDPWTTERDFQVVSVARALRYGLEVFGFVQVDQPFPELIEILDIDRDGVAAVILGADGTPIADTHKPALSTSEATELLRRHSQESQSSSTIDDGMPGRQHFVLAKSLEETDWRLFVSVPYGRVLALSWEIAALLLSILLIGAGVLYIVEYRISRRISSPIREISDRLRDVRLDDVELPLATYDKMDELNYLRDSMEAMFGQLQDSARDLADARAAEVRAEYQALQAQINPHFLYNLFSVMAAVARSGSRQRLVDMCTEAGSMLRYVSHRSGGTTTIGAEASYATHYANLMKQRFEDGLQIVFDIDQRIADFAVPKLFLQPIIENCYMHGFGKKAPPWQIVVRGHLVPEDQGRRWLIRVVDNGVGIDASLPEDQPPAGQDDHLSSTSRKGGVGLRNIYERFVIYYGEQFVFRIRRGSAEFGEVGTEVQIGGIGIVGP